MWWAMHCAMLSRGGWLPALPACCQLGRRLGTLVGGGGWLGVTGGHCSFNWWELDKGRMCACS